MRKTRLPAWERHEPGHLKRRPLLSFVARLQQLLYLDHDAVGQPFLNPEKPWNGSDICDELSSLLHRYELAPLEPTVWKEVR